MEIEGIIINELPLEEGISQRTGNPWRKKGWVMETLGQYPRKAKFDVMGERVDTFKLEVGKTYAVAVDVESREYNGRWYTDLRAYNFRPLENAQPGYTSVNPAQGGFSQPAQPAAPQFQQPAGPQFGQAAGTQPLPQSDDTEDLPF